MRSSTEKRERLILAAKRLFYRRGFAGTSLSDVAEDSSVPVGNVYYYFKSKESLAEAVVAAYQNDIQEWTRAAELGPTPQERLKLWLRGYFAMSVDGEDWNCPFGRLLIDLRQQSDRLGELACTLYQFMLSWTSKEFALYSDPADSERLAQNLVSRAQGLGILALVLQDRVELVARFQEVENWIDQPS
ncbi:TetR/AcrR family transcriptional regulator [bacterium]|nr:TetR/AcrR family transcriptional regulator [bacterium]